MLRTIFAYAVVITTLAFLCHAQDQAAASTACNFDDGQQMTVRYDANGHDPRLQNGKLWTPGQAPMFLFTSVPLKIGSTQIPVGAYSMYLIPGKSEWTLIVNKDVTAKAKYNQQQDVLRAPMGIGTLNPPSKTASVTLGHVGPKQCSLRVYYGDTGAFVEFDEQ
jgi:hypothetical protein